jgi:hypothetical protein
MSEGVVMENPKLVPGDVVVYRAADTRYRDLNGHLGVVTSVAQRKDYSTHVYAYKIRWLTSYHATLLAIDPSSISPSGRGWSEDLLEKIGHIDVDKSHPD